MLTLALVRPSHPALFVTPPLGIAYLSSYLKRAGYQPLLLDALPERLSLDELVRQCEGRDIVGINTMTVFFPVAAELSRRLKEKGHRVVLGGPHASLLPREALEES